MPYKGYINPFSTKLSFFLKNPDFSLLIKNRSFLEKWSDLDLLLWEWEEGGRATSYLSTVLNTCLLLDLETYQVSPILRQHFKCNHSVRPSTTLDHGRYDPYQKACIRVYSAVMNPSFWLSCVGRSVSRSGCKNTTFHQTERFFRQKRQIRLRYFGVHRAKGPSSSTEAGDLPLLV